MYNKQTTRQVNTVGKSSEFFDRLYLDWYGNLIKYAYRLTLEKSYAEEIVQETFTEAYKKVEILQRHENPVGWLYVTTRNLAWAYLRKAKKINAVMHLDENFERSAIYKEIIKDSIFDDLTKEEADIITKFYKYRKSISEIAKEYGISLSACKMRLKRTRDKLKNKYKNNFFDM